MWFKSALIRHVWS